MSQIPNNNGSGEDMPEGTLENNTLGEAGAPQYSTESSCDRFDTAQMGKPERQPRPPRRISVSAFVISSLALILAAVMVTYTVCSAVYKRKLAEVQLGASQNLSYGERYYPFELFDMFLDKYSFEEYDEETMISAALKSYVAATGDRYAYYYTADEYDQLNKASTGDSEGIGINIIYSEAQVNGNMCKVIRVINVSKDSPAYKFGLQVGDLIYSVYDGSVYKTVDELGYEVAMTQLKGESGTEAVFMVLRPHGNEYEPIDCHILRSSITVDSVYYRKHSTDGSVGVVKILNFDKTTPSQFSNAVDTLKSQGCTRFVFDVRQNPGGELVSIKTVLSYFLDEGDVIIRTLYNDGTEEIGRVEVTNYTGAYSECNVTKDDIGKYKGLDAVILCNGSTASAAELFVATFRDYGLAKIVGQTTFGKGSMQSIIPLSYYGYSGALKLTVAKYYSGANGGYNDGYDGVGIKPDVTVEQPSELASKNIYEITDEEDAQLKKALEYFG